MTHPTRPANPLLGRVHPDMDYLAFVDPEPNCPGYVLVHGWVSRAMRDAAFLTIVNRVGWTENWWFDQHPFRGLEHAEIAPQWLDYVQRHVRPPEWRWWRWAHHLQALTADVAPFDSARAQLAQVDPEVEGAFMAAMVIFR